MSLGPLNGSSVITPQGSSHWPVKMLSLLCNSDARKGRRRGCGDAAHGKQAEQGAGGPCPASLCPTSSPTL